MQCIIWVRQRQLILVINATLNLCCLLFCVRFSFFSGTKPRDWLGRTSPKWPIVCWVGLNRLSQSVSQPVCQLEKFTNQGENCLICSQLECCVNVFWLISWLSCFWGPGQTRGNARKRTVKQKVQQKVPPFMWAFSSHQFGECTVLEIFFVIRLISASSVYIVCCRIMIWVKLTRVIMMKYIKQIILQVSCATYSQYSLYLF